MYDETQFISLIKCRYMAATTALGIGFSIYGTVVVALRIKRGNDEGNLLIDFYGQKVWVLFVRLLNLYFSLCIFYLIFDKKKKNYNKKSQTQPRPADPNGTLGTQKWGDKKTKQQADEFYHSQDPLICQ